ncbi:hypothetical protein LIER_15247 [Lithospermum erythrorhizon]|uniref:glucose-6-phosphate dehydrogenase (NADP(+)) n=1 Tax=Lithospermum erythrorhizon TaxID=34254 RepID=A0AAV3Q6Q8_LITER
MSQATGLPPCWHIKKRDPLKSDSFIRIEESVNETGCLSIIVLGASGDLAKKKTFPALFNLYRQVRYDDEVVSEFLRLVKYVSGSYDTPEGFQALDEAIAKHEICRNTTKGTVQRLFYLALPPSVYPPLYKMIKITT